MGVNIIVAEDLLPSLPSAILTAALDDMEKAEKDPTYRINMSLWHSGYVESSQHKQRCDVCLGGAALAFSCKWPKELFFDTDGHDIPDTLEAKLYFLNEIRVGDIDNALCYLPLPNGMEEWPEVVDYMFYTNIPEYSDDPRQFKYMLRELAKELKEAGI